MNEPIFGARDWARIKNDRRGEVNKELTRAELNAINNRAAKSGRAVQYFFEKKGKRLMLVRARIIHPSLINQL